MWRIFAIYSDKSKVTLTGKHKDIPLRLARKYYLKYVNGRQCIRADYQQYPKKGHKSIDLMEKIEQLEQED